jgi:molybdopterin molybdotransferase
LAKWGVEAEWIHLIDNEALIIKELKKCLSAFDVLLVSGGVSEGKLDYVPQALATLGVQKLFHKVQQRPGKPFWFGKVLGGATVFALPGNPVSAFLCALRYVEPWLRKSLGLAATEEKFAILTEEVIFEANLTYFLQVQLKMDEQGRTLAKPIAGGGSGDLANLVEADGFLELPIGKKVYKSGDVFPFWKYR